MIAVTCKYTPVELLAGYGAHCVRINPAADTFENAGRVSHPNLCSFGKSLIQTCIEHNLREVVLVNCCDSIRRTYDILREWGGLDFVYLMDLPHDQTTCGRQRLRDELIRLGEAYDAYAGEGFHLRRFLRAFAQPVQPPREDHLRVLGARVSEELLDMIRRAAPLPVYDETCAGSRGLLAPPQTFPDMEGLLDWYAGELMRQTPCMRMTDVTRRRALSNDPHCKGILYHTVKFCDYYGFEYERLRTETQTPLLKLESDYTTQCEGQLRTRVEAFAESLQLHEQRGNAPMAHGKEYVAGIDSGSTSTNAVILNRNREIVGASIVPTGARAAQGAEKALAAALEQAGLSQDALGAVISTGYGRANIADSTRDVTEITCHAKGAFFLDPSVRTIIDIGGQDSKVIRVDESGAVRNFVMNDKCAAGTGRFLEMMARVLELKLDEMSVIGLTWSEDIPISSMCTVFAESEVVSLVAQNKRVEDIVHGLNNAVATKTVALVNRIGPEGAYMMTGGVASNRGVVRAIEEKLRDKLIVANQAQLCGALGAALIALEDGTGR